MVGAQRVLITGGNSGIGFEAARQLLKLGHHVIITCRDQTKAQKALEALKPVADETGASVDSALLDLSSLQSVRQGAADVLRRHPSLDVVCCNAGVMSSGGRGAPLQYTAEGYEATLGVNHLGHFLLVHMLLPALAASPAARVVVVSSELHRRATAVATATATGTGVGAGGQTGAETAAVQPGTGGLPLASPEWLARLRRAGGDPSSSSASSYGLSGMQLYCISKLYNLWFTYKLADMLLPYNHVNITCNAVTPGWVPGTALGRGVPWLARMAYQYLMPLLPFAVSVHEGARRVVAVCVGAQEGLVRGNYFSKGAQATSSPESRDQQVAAALWALSERAAGVPAGGYLPAGLMPGGKQPEQQQQQQQQKPEEGAQE